MERGRDIGCKRLPDTGGKCACRVESARDMADLLGAIALYGAATRRWLERDSPDISAALHALAQLTAQVRRASSIIHADLAEAPDEMPQCRIGEDAGLELSRRRVKNPASAAM